MTPPAARAVELMSSGHTTPEALTFLNNRLNGIGMHPVVVHKEFTGFVFNRLWAAIKLESLMVLSESVSTPEELDGFWKDLLKTPMGPCETIDAVDLDTVASVEQHYMNERKLSGVDTVDFLRSKYSKQGKLGPKTSKGGFYPPGQAAKSPESD